MEMNLVYLPREDRMRFSIGDKSEWLFNRNLLLKLVQAWLEKLEKIDLPRVDIPLGQRDLEQEHRLSIEFDAPKNLEYIPARKTEEKLLEEVTLSVNAIGTQLVLKCHDTQTSLSLTRKESHMVLELFARKVREVQWIDSPKWPQWLGTGESQ